MLRELLLGSMMCLAAAGQTQVIVTTAERDKLLDALVLKLSVESNRGDVFALTEGDFACDCLVEIGKPAVPKLVGALKSPIDWTRIHAAECLSRMKAKEAYRALTDAIKAEAIQDFKAALLPPLGNLNAPGSEDFLLPLASDPNPEIRQAALEGLEGCATSKAIPVLIEHLTDKVEAIPSTQLVLSMVASRALARIGSASDDALIKAFRGGSDEVKQAASFGLSSIGDARDIAFLTEALGRPNDVLSILPYNLKPCAPGIESSVLKLLKGDDPAVLLAACQFLAGRADKRATAAVIQMMARLSTKLTTGHDEEYGQLLWVATTVLSGASGFDSGQPRERFANLVRGTDRIPTTAIRSLLDKPSDRKGESIWSAERLLSCLVRAHDVLARPIFERYAYMDWKNHEEGEAARRGAEGCGMIGLKALAPLTKAFLEGRIDPSIFAYALPQTTDPACLSILKQMARRPETQIRESAIEGLGGIPTKGAESFLVKLLSVPQVARPAAFSLASRGSMKCWRYLVIHGLVGKCFFDLTRLSIDDLNRCQREAGLLEQLPFSEELTRRHDSKGIEGLERMAKQGPPDQAERAVGDLRKHPRSKRVAQALLFAFHRPEVRVKASAFLALRAIGAISS